ncbi:MAG: hypothetical protein Q4E33_03425 [Erysipelotrichaceae bacterium]|nr:hypothetical protein [Erysipelotrichaceae bacterium]
MKKLIISNISYIGYFSLFLDLDDGGRGKYEVFYPELGKKEEEFTLDDKQTKRAIRLLEQTDFSSIEKDDTQLFLDTPTNKIFYLDGAISRVVEYHSGDIPKELKPLIKIIKMIYPDIIDRLD